MHKQITAPAKAADRSSFDSKLQKAYKRWQARRPIAEDLLSKRTLILFGFGGKGQWLAHHIKRQGKHELAVFDTSPEKRLLAREQGFEVLETLKTSEQAHHSIILGACQDQIGQRSHAPVDFLYYHEASCLLKVPAIENLCGDFQDHVLRDADELFVVWQNLSSASRDAFLAVLEFRLSLDPIDLQASRRPNAAMWLDITAKMRRRPYDTFIDVGAFDGDTLRAFHQTFGCQRGIAVEANPGLFDQIRRVGTLYPRGLEILPMAAWSRRTNLHFTDVRGGMIRVEERDDGGLRASPIDDYVSEPIDILKMDIEGAEAQALTGSARLLATSQPDLALAAYHRPQDLIELPAQLAHLGYDQGFQWHFGHYSDCIDDSIFYVLRSDSPIS